MQDALHTKREELRGVDAEIAAALSNLHEAEAATAMTPGLSSEDARAKLRASREKKEYVEAAISGLTRQREALITSLRNASPSVRIALNIRAGEELQTL